MFKGRLIRLFIYLVISIAVIVLLFNIPTQDQSVKKKSKKSDTSRDSSVIEIQLPEKEKEADPMDLFPVEIDSLDRYIYGFDPISLDELLKEIRVQKEKRPKLFLKITVHPRSKTEVLMNLVEFANEEKLKIGITKN